jgi:hypothetical protein
MAKNGGFDEFMNGVFFGGAVAVILNIIVVGGFILLVTGGK